MYTSGSVRIFSSGEVRNKRLFLDTEKEGMEKLLNLNKIYVLLHVLKG